jgi:NifU-like protein involved in Fe-S cluster formation
MSAHAEEPLSEVEMASRSTPLYTTEILRLAASLQEERALERESGRAEMRSPTCGSRITLAVELDDDRRVRMISQRVHACAFGQASAALVQQHAIGRAHDEVAEALVTLSRWLAQEQDEAGTWPGVAALEPARPRKGRHGAILLPFRALLAAMEAAR